MQLADHIIVAKSRLDNCHKGLKGEAKGLVLFDDFTEMIGAYPAVGKSAEECLKAFRRFLGRRKAVELHSDNAHELELTACELGLVHDTAIPYRKTAIINCKIRALEDIARCCLAQVGNYNELWPLAIRYSATALTLNQWKTLHGHDFEGLRIPFGAFIHYKPSTPKSKLGPETSAGRRPVFGLEARGRVELEESFLRLRC